MSKKQFRTVTGLFLILTSLVLASANTFLSMTFEYPGILRQPAAYVLPRFNAGGTTLIAAWYAFMLGAVLFVALVVMMHSLLLREDTPHMRVATTIGVLAGIVQFLGLIRWVFLVPYLAKTFLDPAASQATRDAVTVVFHAFNQYAGMAVGEHLGYLFTSVWTMLAALAMRQSPLFKPWLGWFGVIIAVCIFIGIFEPVGFGAAVAINAVGYSLWALWAIIAGILVLRAPQESGL